MGAGTASGLYTTAMGRLTRATGDHSTAMGTLAAADFAGSFIYGDASTLTTTLNEVTDGTVGPAPNIGCPVRDGRHAARYSRPDAV